MHCSICDGFYPIDKHDFKQCCSVDTEWDIKQIDSKKYTYIDLFCGMGSFHYSFAKFGWTCVMASDICENARTVYHNNYNMQPLGDVCKIDPLDVPNYDIVCAGFSCQPFSRCGKQLGFDDPRGTMFYQVMKFAVRRPKFIIMENVQGLLNHDDGKHL